MYSDQSQSRLQQFLHMAGISLCFPVIAHILSMSSFDSFPGHHFGRPVPFPVSSSITIRFLPHADIMQGIPSFVPSATDSHMHPSHNIISHVSSYGIRHRAPRCSFRQRTNRACHLLVFCDGIPWISFPRSPRMPAFQS